MFTRHLTAQFRLALLIAVAFPAMALAVDDPDPARLQREIAAAYRAGDYEKALKAAEKYQEIEPDDPNNLYNIACLHCLLGHKDKAYEWLEKAIDEGYNDADHLADDADFKTIRGEDRFRKIVKELRQPAKGKEKEDADDEDEDEDEDDQPVRKAAPKKEESDEDDEEDEDENEVGANIDKQRKVGELTQKLVQAAENEEYDKALKYALEARKIADIGLTNYNVACMYSLLNKKDEALTHLERAAELGNFPGDMAVQMEGDSDLDNIRKDPRYAAVLKKVKSKGDADEDEDDGGEDKPAAKMKVTLPEGYDKSEEVPLIVVLHGKGGNMEETTKVWKGAASKVGAILLTPEGTQKADDGFQWGTNIETVDEVVTDAVNKVMDKHKIAKGKVVIAGFSQGARAAWGLALRNPDTFCGVIPVAGWITGPDAEFDIEELKDLHVYAMIGADDKPEGVKANKTAVGKLKKLGAQARVVVFDDLGHEYPPEEQKELVKALKFVLQD